ncbi:FxsA family protein [Andreprevotia chitinilytica]|uniref:FxsA family protein n=1 Tax=Andreprevotia chitinilytica TaxID=396808 RepID=UPI00068B938E|nr:FxsA family protein [Andreprevotia chitinilytica]
MPYLLLALLAWPAVEIIALVLLAKAIGTGWVLAWLAVTAVAGVLMLRHHKWAVGMSLLNDARSGRLSVGSLFWVARYYIAALLLVLPGVIGDVVALIMLLPWGRRAGMQVPTDNTLEGEFRRVDRGGDAAGRINRFD